MPAPRLVTDPLWPYRDAKEVRDDEEGSDAGFGVRADDAPGTDAPDAGRLAVDDAA